MNTITVMSSNGSGVYFLFKLNGKALCTCKGCLYHGFCCHVTANDTSGLTNFTLDLASGETNIGPILPEIETWLTQRLNVLMQKDL